MIKLLISLILQITFLLLLLAKDKNDGEKEVFKKQNWSFLDIAIFIISLNLFRIFQYSIVKFNIVSIESIKSPCFFVFFYFSSLHLFLLMLLILIFIRKNLSLNILGTKMSKNIWILGIIGGGVSFVVYLALFFIAKPDIEPFKELKYLTGNITRAGYITMLILCGPAIEEIIFRGIMYSPFRKKYGPFKAIFIVSVIFTLAHYEFTLYSILVSVLWGYLYEKTESIITPIVAHSSTNLFSLITFMYLI